MTTRTPAGSTPAAVPAVALINPDNPRAGVVHCSHQIFGSAGIQFQSYQRNRFHDGVADGTKTCLRVVGTVRHGQNDYGSPKEDDESATLEIEGDALFQVNAVLAGVVPSYQLRIAREGRAPKALAMKHQPASPNGAFYLSISEGKVQAATPFGLYHAWVFRLVLADVLHRLHPQHDRNFLLGSFTDMARLHQVAAGTT